MALLLLAVAVKAVFRLVTVTLVLVFMMAQQAALPDMKNP
jgi:hypothetical protein